MASQVLGSTIVFAPFSLDQALEGLAEVGYTHCEVGAVKGWFEHIDPDTATDKEIAHAEAKLKETGLTLVSMSGHTQLQTAEGKARFTRCMEIAASLGAQIVNTYTGDAATDEEREAYFATVADPIEDIAYAIPRMVHFHFKDKIGGQGVFNFPPPGDGELDMKGMLQLCAEGGYTGPISAEVEFDDKSWPDLDGCRAAAKRSIENLHAMGLSF